MNYGGAGYTAMPRGGFAGNSGPPRPNGPSGPMTGMGMGYSGSVGSGNNNYGYDDSNGPAKRPRMMVLEMHSHNLRKKSTQF